MQPYSCDSQTTFCGLHSVFICLPHVFSSQSFDLIVVTCKFFIDNCHVRCVAQGNKVGGAAKNYLIVAISIS